MVWHQLFPYTAITDGVYNGQGVCSLWGGKWNFTHNTDKRQSSKTGIEQEDSATGRPSRHGFGFVSFLCLQGNSEMAVKFHVATASLSWCLPPKVPRFKVIKIRNLARNTNKLLLYKYSPVSRHLRHSNVFTAMLLLSEGREGDAWGLLANWCSTSLPRLSFSSTLVLLLAALSVFKLLNPS